MILHRSRKRSLMVLSNVLTALGHVQRGDGKNKLECPYCGGVWYISRPEGWKRWGFTTGTIVLCRKGWFRRRA